jgi:ferredoxin
VAIGHGKKAARSIDAFLRGTGSPAAGKHAPASFGALNIWYYADASATVRPRLEAGPADHHLRRGDRQPGLLDRAVRGTPLHVLRQLLRRLPDNAIIKLGSGLCIAECPADAIEMEPEPS